MTLRRLERVLAVKGRLRDVLRGELARADDFRAQARTADDAARRVGAALRQGITGSGELHAGELAQQAELVRVARARSEETRAALEDAELRRETARAALERSSVEVRGLETAHARELRRREVERARAERREIDDLVAVRSPETLAGGRGEEERW